VTRRTACAPAAARISWKARVNRGSRSWFRKRFPVRKPSPTSVRLRPIWLIQALWLTFRRTYSSWSHEKGIPGTVIAQVDGARGGRPTLNIYIQVLEGSVRAAPSAPNCSQLMFTDPGGWVR